MPTVTIPLLDQLFLWWWPDSRHTSRFVDGSLKFRLLIVHWHPVLSLGLRSSRQLWLELFWELVPLDFVVGSWLSDQGALEYIEYMERGKDSYLNFLFAQFWNLDLSNLWLLNLSWNTTLCLPAGVVLQIQKTRIMLRKTDS